MNRYLAALCAVLSFYGIQAAEAQDHSEHQEHMPTQEPDHSTHGTSGKQATALEQAGPTESERRHVPPDPPQHTMGEMTNHQMIEMMAMDDTSSVGTLMLDQFEWRKIDRQDVLGLEANAWYGNDYNKAWFKAEGEVISGDYEGRTELLWDRVVSRWFNVQAGVRHDVAEEGPSRSWLALGVQGLAPYWFEIEATAYVGDEGRTALRFSGEYEVLLTQRLILQPEIDVDVYGKDDPRNGIGSGLSEAEIALRLRYEIRREFAPYFGIVWSQRFGDTADFARAEGQRKGEVQFAAGLRVWF